MLVPTSKLKGHNHGEWCPVPLALETPGKTHSGSAVPELPPSASTLWVKNSLVPATLKERKAARNLMRQQMPTLALTSEIRTRQRGGKSTNFPFGSSDLVSSPEPCLRACGLSLLPWPHLCPSASLKGLLLSWPRPPRLEPSPSLTGPAVAPSQLGVEAPSALHRGPNVFSLKHSSEPLSSPLQVPLWLPTSRRTGSRY